MQLSLREVHQEPSDPPVLVRRGDGQVRQIAAKRKVGHTPGHADQPSRVARGHDQVRVGDHRREPVGIVDGTALTERRFHEHLTEFRHGERLFALDIDHRDPSASETGKGMRILEIAPRPRRCTLAPMFGARPAPARARCAVIVAMLAACGSVAPAPRVSEPAAPRTTRLAALPSASEPDAAAPRTPPALLRGVNLAGAEFGDGGELGKTYMYPDAKYAPGYASPRYFSGRGMNVFRLPFRWE